MPGTTCDVCGRTDQPTVVRASGMGPVSYAYCPECRASGAEPYGGVVAYLFTLVEDVELSNIHEAYHESIDVSLKVAGKTRQDLVNDCAQVMRDLEQYFKDQEGA